MGIFFLYQRKAILMKSKKLLILLSATGLVAPALHSEEGGTGHYMPGQTASFIDALPDREAAMYVNVSTYYEGSGGKSKEFDAGKSTTVSGPLDRRPVNAAFTLGGKAVADVEATVYANTSFLVYQSPWKLFGGRYGTGLAIPFYSMEVTADASLDTTAAATVSGENGSKSASKSKSVGVTERDRTDGLGDILLYPVILGWKKGDV
jgi:hypothetical protein